MNDDVIVNGIRYNDDGLNKFDVSAPRKTTLFINAGWRVNLGYTNQVICL